MIKKNNDLIVKNNAEVTRLNAEQMQACQDLHELYKFFLDAFGRHVFTELNTSDLHNDWTLDLQQLNQALGSVDINQQGDPLGEVGDKGVIEKLQQQTPEQLASAHAKEFHTPQPIAVDKEKLVYQ